MGFAVILVLLTGPDPLGVGSVTHRVSWSGLCGYKLRRAADNCFDL